MSNFCTQCGNKLEGNQTCGCQSQENLQATPVTEQQEYVQQSPPLQQSQEQEVTREAEWVSEKKEKVISEARNIFAQIVPLLKAPITKTQEIVSKNNPIIGWEFIGIKVVAYLIVVFIIMGGKFAGFFWNPDFAFILKMLILIAAPALLEIAACKIISGTFNMKTTYNSMIIISGTHSLFDAIGIIAVGIISIISLEGAMLLWGAITACLLPFLHYGCYRAVVLGKEDKKLYAYALSKLVVAVAIFFVIRILFAEVGDVMSMMFFA